MTIIALGTIAILGYGSYQVFIGVLTVGGLVASYSYMARLFDPLNAAVEIYSRFEAAQRKAFRESWRSSKWPRGVEERNEAVYLPSPVRGHVKIEDLSFSYRTGQPVLQKLNLKLEAGEKVALVGISGSGKSTVAKLIARLYDTNRGAVYIDGIDVRNIRLESLRTRICYLMQDAVLFDRTLKENLLLGKPSATHKELHRAIEITDLGEVVRRLPNGWDTPLGPRGNALSGGERQRVALARAVLQYPSLLLLDESTSALDAPSEQRVFENLAEHFRIRPLSLFRTGSLRSNGWTTIVALNRGVVEEQGKHDQLIRRGGPLHLPAQRTAERIHGPAGLSRRKNS